MHALSPLISYMNNKFSSFKPWVFSILGETNHMPNPGGDSDGDHYTPAQTAATEGRQANSRAFTLDGRT
jgi:hypothetical protein